MDVTVLGPLRVSGRPEARSRDRVVLQVLVMQAGRVASVDQLLDALWREQPPASARKILQGCVVRIRQALGDDAIRTEAPGYRLDPSSVRTDVAAFEAAAAVALAGDDAAAEDALRLWTGDPFSDLADWAPARPVIDGLHALRVELVGVTGRARLERGEPAAALTLVEPVAALHPYDEALWALVARSRYAAGRPTEALATLRALRRRLIDDLGVRAGAEVAALESELLARDPTLPGRSAGPVASPWPGLLPFERADTDRFFGREEEADAAIRMIDATGRVVVVGRSGCGKSSFVRAGLVARLEAEGRTVRVITPGADPVAALAGVPDDVCVVIDQAEEVLTQCADEAARAAFLDQAASRLGETVVVVRADLFDGLASFAGFSALLRGGALVVRPLGEDALRSAVERTAQVAGLLLEPGLVELVLSDGRGDPAALPMVSHALAETCRATEGHLLTVAGYRAVGGLQGAVVRTAEEVYGRLHSLAARLVATQDGVVVRLRADRDSVDTALCERLLAARLLSLADDGRVQLSHESLVQQWPRLASWIAEDEEGRRVLQHLAGEARDWEDAARSPDQLYRGARLRTAAAWADEHPDELAELERSFLRASAVAERQGRRRALSGRRRAAVAVAALVVLLVATAAIGLVAADRQRQVAEATEQVIAERAAARATSIHDPSLALALVAEALAVHDSWATRTSALEVFGRFADLLPADPAAAVGARAGGGTATSPDGRLAARVVERGVDVEDRASGDVVARIRDLPTVPSALAFDGAGRLLAGSLNDAGFADAGTTIVWDVPSGVEVGRFDSGDGLITANVFSADSTSVSAVGPDGAHRWDLTGSSALVTSRLGEPFAFRWKDGLDAMNDRTVDDWIARGCALAGRSLTGVEWRRYFGRLSSPPRCRVSAAS